MKEIYLSGTQNKGEYEEREKDKLFLLSGSSHETPLYQ